MFSPNSPRGSREWFGRLHWVSPYNSEGLGYIHWREPSNQQSSARIDRFPWPVHIVFKMEHFPACFMAPTVSPVSNSDLEVFPLLRR